MSCREGRCNLSPSMPKKMFANVELNTKSNLGLGTAFYKTRK